MTCQESDVRDGRGRRKENKPTIPVSQAEDVESAASSGFCPEAPSGVIVRDTVIPKQLAPWA